MTTDVTFAAVGTTKGTKRSNKRSVTKAKAPAKASPTKAQTKPAGRSRKPVSTRPSVPVAPLPPGPPPARIELTAERDVGRLTRYGERFGAWKLDVRLATQPATGLPLQLPIASGTLAIGDPAVPKSWHVLDRPAGGGHFRVMPSIARTDDGKQRLAALAIHVGRPPIAKWTIAHWKGTKPPKSADQLPTITVTSGWIALYDAAAGSPGVIATPATNDAMPIEIPLTDGRRALAIACGNGEVACYWAIDATDKPIALVLDFDAFTAKEWRQSA